MFSRELSGLSKDHVVHLFAKFHQNLMDSSQVIWLNPFKSLWSDYIYGLIFIPFDSPNNIRYSFYSYISSKTFSFLNPIVLKRINWIILRSRFFLKYMFASIDDKPYPTTFGQISSKSNEAFSNYAPKTSFFDINPL